MFSCRAHATLLVEQVIMRIIQCICSILSSCTAVDAFSGLEVKWVKGGGSEVKPGNNGAVSCDAYCQSPQWGAPFKSCASAVDLRTGKLILCKDQRGSVPGYDVTCYCRERLGTQTNTVRVSLLVSGLRALIVLILLCCLTWEAVMKQWTLLVCYMSWADDFYMTYFFQNILHVSNPNPLTPPKPYLHICTFWAVTSSR